MNEPSNSSPATSLADILTYVLAAILGVGLFYSGMQFGRIGTEAEGQAAGLWSFFSWYKQETVESTPDMTEFWRVWNTLDEKFAVSTSTALTDEEKIVGAINGLVGAYGDPYTVYLPPAENAAFNDDISGEFSGVGMEVGMRDGLITVIAPLAETPAEQAGVMAGDVIVRIDDVSTENMRVDDAVDLIRGERGTAVVLTLYREGEPEFLEISIVRDNIEIPTIKTETIDEVFVITLYSFNAVAEAKFEEAMQAYAASGKEKLVVDVRGNPGGYLQSAVAIAGHFLPAGKVVVREEFSDSTMNDVYRTRTTPSREFTPDNLVVLVDGGSASASEILAGALQDHGVATVIGAQTFGKGSVQELIEYKNGAALKVTIARWLTPNGTSISEDGLTPDIVISRTPAQRLADEDPQQAAALQFLRGETVASESFEAGLQPPVEQEAN